MTWIIRDIPLGKNIKSIRKSKHLTQKDVTTKLQLMGSYMSEDTLSNIETGRRNIKASDTFILYIYIFHYKICFWHTKVTFRAMC